jgi:predicted ATP-grasp superfamily ATP-dependent carboligase
LLCLMVARAATRPFAAWILRRSGICKLLYVEDVVKHCESIGFWGFCGIDVLFDKEGVGHLVDVNPRVAGSSPALMIMHLLMETPTQREIRL